MKWQNTETPTFTGSDGSKMSGPDVVETLSAIDRDGNVIATFTKSVAGVASLVCAGDITDGSGNTLASVLGVSDVWNYKGATNCSTNPNYPAGNAGDLYKVSVAGKIGGASGTVVKVGDVFVCNTDGTTTGTEAQKGTAWDHFPATSDIPVKASGAELNTGSDDAKFATAKALADSDYAKTSDIPVKASGAEIDTGTDDAKYVTAKAIADSSLGSGGGGTLVDEIPTGAVNGINDAFVFAGTPVAVFRNGVAYAPDEFSVAGTTATLDEAPATGVISGLTQGAIADETPTGAVDGENADFVFAGFPFAVFRNGVKYASNEYSIAGKTVTLDVAPSSGVITGLTQ